MGSIYAPVEHTYCNPFAEEFAKSGEFFNWVLRRIVHADWVGNARSMAVEQRMRRARFWWKNYYCHESKCQCPGLAGREIDILLFVERSDGARMALHVECKHPKDTLSPGQAAAYPVRAQCWLHDKGRPKSVLPHDVSATMLICSRSAVFDKNEKSCFGRVVFFDEIAAFISPYPEPPQSTA